MSDYADDPSHDPERTITPRPGVSVFRNDLDEICVRQVWPDEVDVSEDLYNLRFVRIPPECAEQVARWILQVAGEIRGELPVKPA